MDENGSENKDNNCKPPKKPNVTEEEVLEVLEGMITLLNALNLGHAALENQKHLEHILKFGTMPGAHLGIEKIVGLEFLIVLT